jgi:hypothetical protein
MNCYICERTTQAYTLRFGIAAAVGVCHDCGIGICFEHSRKAAEPGASLLCAECAARRTVQATMPRLNKSQPAKVGV